MSRDNFSDLLAFIAVARARSFTRAAAQLRVTQPALSYTIRTLEEKLGVRLLMRSTRGVSPTEAGQRLLDRLAPEFDEIEAEIQSLGELRDEPMGTIRITAIDYAIRSTLWPKLAKFLPKYPKIKVELVNEYESVDIVARGYDAGVRFGQELAQDMISVRIGPDVRNMVVGSKSYFAGRRPTQDTARPHRARLHQPAHIHVWRPLRMGVRQGQAHRECTGGWSGHLQ